LPEHLDHPRTHGRFCTQSSAIGLCREGAFLGFDSAVDFRLYLSCSLELAAEAAGHPSARPRRVRPDHGWRGVTMRLGRRRLTLNLVYGLR
jgi:hypothetical protein